MSYKVKDLVKQIKDLMEMYCDKTKIYSGLKRENRIYINNPYSYFEFGDVRCETESYYIIVEIESAGDITNLVKFWYCIEQELIKNPKPIILFHFYKQNSPNDYKSRLELWNFLYNKKISKELKEDKFKAYCYTDFEKMKKDLERILEEQCKTK